MSNTSNKSKNKTSHINSPQVTLIQPVENNSPNTCQNCKHWYQDDKYMEVGECREGPPSLTSTKFHELGNLLAYRLTLSVLPSCGKFQVR